jgi:hypothetical protein
MAFSLKPPVNLRFLPRRLRKTSLKLPCGFKTAMYSSSRGLRKAVEQYNRRVKEYLKNSKPFARMNIYIYLI